MKPMSSRANPWSLPRPLMVMAPMANVTDEAFRRMFAECGPPDVFWTEFVSVEGLLSPKGRGALLVDLWHSKDEHPIVAQIFGAKPAQFEEAAALIADLGFDGIDINMGCPDEAVGRQGAGAALVADPARAAEIIRAAKRGAGGLPVSVKTRIGLAKDQLDEWIPALLEEDIAALTVHLRTRKEMSDVPAHWELAPRIAALRARYAPHTLVLGNGDVASLAEARRRAAETGIDGVMIGRGLFGNPWFFSGRVPEIEERLERMVSHAALFEKLYGNGTSPRGGRLKNFSVMRKHFKAYAAGFDGAKELRAELMETETVDAVRGVVARWIKAHPEAAA